MYERKILKRILKSLKNNPVVAINGARQVGKSTLIEALIEAGFDAEYLTFDDATTLYAAGKDPYGFLNAYNKSIAIDEVQRELKIFMAIKRIVDREKIKGQFLLTGSADVLTVPKIAESLAGRMVLHTLWPLSQSEIESTEDGFIEWAFQSSKIPRTKDVISNSDLCDKIIAGGYPRSVSAEDAADRTEWMSSYLDTVIQRDIRDLSNIEGLRDLPNILSVIAERIGGMLNLADVSRMLQINQVTLKRYYALLQMVFLIVELQPWYINTDKRLVKSPKVYLNDTGLACYLKRVSKEDLIKDRQYLGALLENFVVMELQKQASCSAIKPRLYHFRTQAGKEVDIVLEGAGKDIVGIEVKSATFVEGSDLKGMKELQSIAKQKFKKGIIFYTGDKIMQLDEKIYCMPINSLWSCQASCK